MTVNIFPVTNKLTADFFRNNRSYFYVLVLIIGACFTDSPSGKEQAMIAIPLMLAFEWAIILMDKFRK
jgi:Sec-independent protein secretion pathway component TatC